MKRVLGMALLIFLLSATAVAGVSRDGVTLEREVTVNGERLQLFGYGTARYARVFRVYVAGLYGPRGVSPEALLDSDVPRRLEIEYLRSISADDINEATERMLERQLDPGTLAAVRERFDTFAALYEDVEQGDRYAFEYVPGQGATLYFNGRPVGTVEGEDFARAYLGIWIGEEPLSGSLKRELLGGR